MKKVRYYYSDDLRLGKVEVVLNNFGNPVALSDLIGPIKFLPRNTICGIYDDEESTMTFGVARCASKDDFVKSVGREISLKRAETNPIRVVHIHPTQKVSDVFMEHALDIDLAVQAMKYPIKL